MMGNVRGWWVWLALLAGCSNSWADYRLGQGLPVGDFLLSGYVNVVAEAPKNGLNQISLDDLSLFASGHVNRWINPFVEMEITSYTLADENGNNFVGGHFVPERMYNDFHLSDANTVRVGKMLSPVGDWNAMHAAPLVATTTRPLTTFRGFSEYVSGVAWVHESPSGEGPDWQLYGQHGDEWAARSVTIAPRRYHNVWGLHVNWPIGFADKVGLSLQHGRLLATGEDYTLLGANGRKSFGRLTLEGEAIAARWSGHAVRAHDHEWGAYGLADYSLDGPWHVMFEGEQYQDHQRIQRSKNVLLGFAYKPGPASVWKVEYVHQYGVSHLVPTGWMASYAALF